MTKSWLHLALLAMVFLVPCWMAIPFFKRNFGVQAELYLMFFLIGTAGGVLVWGNVDLPRELVRGSFKTSMILFAALSVGVFLGSWANLFGFRAVEVAGTAKAGMAVAVLGSAPILIYLLTFPLAWLLPRWFEEAKFKPLDLVGILLTIAGISLLALKR